MKKKLWLVLGAVLLVMAVTVAAVVLLRQPPLIREDGIESVVIFKGGIGHKELTDPAEYAQVLKLLNGTRYREAPEDPRKGWNNAVYIFYEDHSRMSVWLTVKTEDYVDAETGITHPAGEYLSVWPDGYYSVKEGTDEAVIAFADSIDRPYETGILPEERMREAGLID